MEEKWTAMKSIKFVYKCYGVLFTLTMCLITMIVFVQLISRMSALAQAQVSKSPNVCWRLSRDWNAKKCVGKTAGNSSLVAPGDQIWIKEANMVKSAKNLWQTGLPIDVKAPLGFQLWSRSSGWCTCCRPVLQTSQPRLCQPVIHLEHPLDRFESEFNHAQSI